MLAKNIQFFNCRYRAIKFKVFYDIRLSKHLDFHTVSNVWLLTIQFSTYGHFAITNVKVKMGSQRRLFSCFQILLNKEHTLKLWITFSFTSLINYPGKQKYP